MTDKKEYIEAEILDKNFKREDDNFQPNFEADPVDQFNILLKKHSWTTLIAPIFILLAIFTLFIAFLFWILPTFIALFIIAIFIAFLTNLILKILKIFKGKK